VTNVGDGGGRGGDQFRRVVLGEFRSEIGGEGEPVENSCTVLTRPLAS
jgi:hypothetical protein